MEGIIKTSKFKATAKHAISRLELLKTRHLARYSVSLSDVLQLLQLGHHQKAIDRVQMVIKEQDWLHAFDIIEGYCYLLIEMIDLIQQERILPQVVKEAISSLIYAATRCGEFPELQDFRLIFTSWCGKEFVASAVELRNNCGVNPKIIQKLSTKLSSFDNRLKLVNKIAAENKIVIQLEAMGLDTSQEKIIESATYVAAVEFIQPDSHDSNTFKNPSKGSLNPTEKMKSKLGKTGKKDDAKAIKDLEVRKVGYRNHPLQVYSSEPSKEEEEIVIDDMVQRLKNAAHYRKKLAAERAESAHKTFSENDSKTEDLSFDKNHGLHDDGDVVDCELINNLKEDATEREINTTPYKSFPFRTLSLA